MLGGAMSSKKLLLLRVVTAVTFIFIIPISLAENDSGVRQGPP
jgi:hypothetical protein